MITFTITNEIIENETEKRIFYLFSNYEENSWVFPINATQEEINAWGEERAAFFDWREQNPPREWVDSHQATL